MTAMPTSRAVIRALVRQRTATPRHLTRRTVATYTAPRQAAQLSILPTTVDTNSATYRDNASSMSSLVQKLSHLHTEAAKGGPEKARQKHIQRGKMLVRDRITALIDPGTSFLELSALAGHEMYEGEAVSAGGMVTGIGTVEGVMCMIVANDSTYVPTKTLLPSSMMWRTDFVRV